MRVVSRFVAAMVLAFLAQPAAASCVYHGTAKVCRDDPKDFTPARVVEPATPEKAAQPDPAPSSLKTIVMQPSASVDNAWVVMPESGDGAAVPGLIPVAVPACELGTNC